MSIFASLAAFDRLDEAKARAGDARALKARQRVEEAIATDPRAGLLVEAHGLYVAAPILAVVHDPIARRIMRQRSRLGDAAWARSVRHAVDTITGWLPDETPARIRTALKRLERAGILRSERVRGTAVYVGANGMDDLAGLAGDVAALYAARPDHQPRAVSAEAAYDSEVVEVFFGASQPAIDAAEEARRIQRGRISDPDEPYLAAHLVEQDRALRRYGIEGVRWRFESHPWLVEAGVDRWVLAPLTADEKRLTKAEFAMLARNTGERLTGKLARDAAIHGTDFLALMVQRTEGGIWAVRDDAIARAEGSAARTGEARWTTAAEVLRAFPDAPGWSSREGVDGHVVHSHASGLTTIRDTARPGPRRFEVTVETRAAGGASSSATVELTETLSAARTVAEGIVAQQRRAPAPEPERQAPAMRLHGVDVDPSDYPLQAARGGYTHLSHDPDGRAARDVEEYMREMQRAAGLITTHGDGDPERARALLAEHRAEYLRRAAARHAADARTASWAITGRSGFNVRSNDKRMQTADARTAELLALTRGLEDRIRRAYLPAGVSLGGAISTDAADPVALLEQKIADLEAQQERMRATNRIIRRKGPSDRTKIEQLADLGIAASVAERLLKPTAGETGFAGYQLKNNAAAIRATRARIEQVKAEQAKPASAYRVEAAGLTVRDDPEANRIRLDFDDKPPAETIARLKANGFRWSRREGVWQRMRTAGTRNTLDRLGWGPPTATEPAVEPPAADVADHWQPRHERILRDDGLTVDAANAAGLRRISGVALRTVPEGDTVEIRSGGRLAQTAVRRGDAWIVTTLASGQSFELDAERFIRNTRPAAFSLFHRTRPADPPGEAETPMDTPDDKKAKVLPFRAKAPSSSKKSKPDPIAERIARAFASAGMAVRPEKTRDGWLVRWASIGDVEDPIALEQMLERELGDVLDFDGSADPAGMVFWRKPKARPARKAKPPPAAQPDLFGQPAPAPAPTPAPRRAPAVAVLDRTRRELHQRAAKATARGTGPLAAVWHEAAEVLASNGRITSAFRADTPSACERWIGRYSRIARPEATGYPTVDVRAALAVIGPDVDVDLRALKRLAKLVKAQPEPRPVGIVRKDGTLYAVAGEALVDGEPIRQDKALGAVKLADKGALEDAAIWVRADDLALALLTGGQNRGTLRLPAAPRSADALLVEIPRLGERHAVRRIEAPAPARVAVRLDAPPAPAAKRRDPPTEGQWAALSCKGGRVAVEHFDSQAAAEEYLAALDGPEWGYVARINAIFREE